MKTKFRAFKISRPRRLLPLLLPLLVIITVLGGAIYGFCWLFVPATLFNRGAGFQVVKAIQSGSLQPDNEGAVKLPASMAGLTWNGKVFVTRKKEGLLLVYFPLWVFIDSGGMLYSSRPLTDREKMQGEFEEPDRPRYDVAIDKQGLAPVEIQRDYGGGWYDVVYRFN